MLMPKGGPRTDSFGFEGQRAAGAIAYEPHGTATEPRAFTQLFANGELWAVTTETFVH
jgi:hypothetical protein